MHHPLYLPTVPTGSLVLPAVQALPVVETVGLVQIRQDGPPVIPLVLVALVVVAVEAVPLMVSWGVMVLSLPT